MTSRDAAHLEDAGEPRYLASGPLAASLKLVISRDAAAKAIGLLTIVLIIRWLNVSALAGYATAAALGAICLQLAVGSTNRAYVMGHLDHWRRPRRSLLMLQLMVAPIAAGFISLVLGLPLTLAVSLLIWTAGGSLTEFLRTLAQRESDFHTYSNAELARRVSALAAIVLLERLSGLTAEGVLLAQGTTGIVVASLGWFSVQQRLLPTRVERPAGLLFTSIIYFSILAILQETDVLMLGWLASERQVASYAGAFRYSLALLALLSSVQAVLLPTTAKQRTPSAAAEAIRELKIPILLLSVVCLAAAAAAPYIIPMLDSGRYPSAIPTFQLLALSAAVSMVLSPWARIALVWGRPSATISASLFSYGLAIVLNFLFIPFWGSVGAALATFATYGFLNVSMLVLASRSMRRAPHRGRAAVV